MLRTKNWVERIRERAEEFQTATVEVVRITGETAPYNVDTNTGGGFLTTVVYRGPARVQQITVNRDREGISSNTTAEVGIRVQLRRDEFWADDFEDPSTYESPKGARKVFRGWNVTVLSGGNNPSLVEEILYIDSAINSNTMAVVDLVCSNILEGKR